MKYVEVEITIDPHKVPDGEIIIAVLAELPFESFLYENPVIKAYIPIDSFDDKSVKDIVNDFINEGAIQNIKCTEIKDENWNIKWEQNFPPIEIGDECIIRAPFHNIEKKYRYEIIIEPKMSFGTGHHETTSLMVEQILKTDLTNKEVLDMGCGTGILAILASMRGAKTLIAIDHDSWAYENTIENLERNRISNVKAYHGDAQLLTEKNFDVILANINRNIILEDLPLYVASLNSKGLMLLSGFYLQNKDIIEEKATSLGLMTLSYQEKNNWIVLNLVKSN